VLHFLRNFLQNTSPKSEAFFKNIASKTPAQSPDYEMRYGK